MPFTLSRSGLGNVPAEVQRWRYFLRPKVSTDRQHRRPVRLEVRGRHEDLQLRAGLPANGKVDVRTLEKASDHGYTIVPDDYDELRAGTDFPPPPSDLSSPSNATRNRDFTCFKFLQVR